MGERTLFPNASTKATLAYCWSQMRPDRAAFAGCCGAIALGTLANAVAAPLIFAALLGRHLRPGRQPFGPVVLHAAHRRLRAAPSWRPRSSAASAAG